MCFSAPASLIAGGALCAVGKETLKKPKQKTDIPFASIPLIFGIQQIIEGCVWLSVGMPALNGIISFAFLMFAYVLWPVFVPIAIRLMEKDALRKKILEPFVAMGLLTGIVLFYSIITGPVSAQAVQFSLSYSSTGNFPGFTIWLYVAATCLSCLVSSHKMVNLFGITLFASCFTAYQCYASSFVSVWCFFAALLSFIVYLHFSPLNDVVRDIKARLKMA